MGKSRAAVSIIALMIGAPAMADTPKSPPDPSVSQAYNRIVQDHILPREEVLLIQLSKEGRTLTLDGTPVFNGADKFLPGKIAMGLVDFLITLPRDDPRLTQYLKNFSQIAKMTVDDTNDSWGGYYYLYALNQLRKAGLLDQAVDRLTLAKLRVRLDWRMFVDPDTYELIDHPNNYYVVAFGMARLRQQMGWDDAASADHIYQKVAAHYHLYSGPFGFADETQGDGRFDRYSVLLAGELANHFIASDATPPKEVLVWLRKSVDVMLMRVHEDGAGFEYGRSLGPYSETAIIETLTAAARLGLLSENEKALAYAYASRAAQRYVSFWLDPETGSVNLWDNGRRTDTYRGKFRILGENLSLAHQYAYTNAAWNALGYKDKSPAKDLTVAIEHLPKEQLTWFARGDYDRLLLTRRDQSYVFGLPLINGARGQHMHNPYFPIPYARGVIEGVPDGEAPLLVPEITLKDGSRLMPLAYFREAKLDSKPGTTSLSFRQSELDRMGEDMSVPDNRLSVSTRYVFAKGRITRTDTFTPKAPLEVAGLRLEFASFSEAPTQTGHRVTFGRGAVTGFSVTGLDGCKVSAVGGDSNYHSDTGPMKTLVRCTSAAKTITTPFTIQWSLTYK
jgi:hypothetical protein